MQNNNEIITKALRVIQTPLTPDQLQRAQELQRKHGITPCTRAEAIAIMRDLAKAADERAFSSATR